MPDTDDKIQVAIRNNSSTWAKWLTIILTVVGMTVAAAVWATTQHSDIKIWTAEQDYVTKQQLETTVEKRYVLKKDFAKVEQCMIDQKEDITDIKNKVDKIFEIIYRSDNRDKR